MRFLISIFCSFFLFNPVWANDSDQPVELGKVKWSRDYEASLAKAERLKLPVLILFQEVPGCATCTQYGKQVLSHPLIVDLIQTQFIPIAIFNNKGGSDSKILKKYGEPSWNNPVVRIVDHQENALAPRLAGNYSSLGLVRMIKRVLLDQKKIVPEYLYLLEDELNAHQGSLSTATYSMYCFWTGEKLFGQLNGVTKTRAGWANGKEVVQVTYNPAFISKKELDKIGAQNSCSAESTVDRYRDDRTPKYYLSNSLYKYIPLTEIQSSRINSIIGSGGNPFDLLSPTQQKWLLMIQKNQTKAFENVVQQDFKQAWTALDNKFKKA